jgi:basic amino acid/polyamine antiporter, APA family
LIGAASLAEPGAMLARSAGQYVIVRRGLGEYPGFVVGWSDWISTCGPVALGGMVFMQYLEPLVPGLAGRTVPLGVLLVLLFGLLLWRGIRIGDLSQQILSAAKALAFGSLIAVCLLVPVPGGSFGPAATLPSGFALVTAILLALQSVIYTYDGWTGPLYFGEETKNPGRDIPRSMVLGVVLVILIYVMVNIAFVRVLGVGRMAGDPFVAASAGKALFGARGDLVIRLIVLISILSGMNACALMAARVLLAMSRERGSLDQHRRRGWFDRYWYRRIRARPLRFLLRGQLHAVIHQCVRLEAEGARHAQTVPSAGVPIHYRSRARGLAGIPGGIGGH